MCVESGEEAVVPDEAFVRALEQRLCEELGRGLGEPLESVRQIVGVREVKALCLEEILHHVLVHLIELLLVLVEVRAALEVGNELELVDLEHLLVAEEAHSALGGDHDQEVAGDELDGAYETENGLLGQRFRYRVLVCGIKTLFSLLVKH